MGKLFGHAFKARYNSADNSSGPPSDIVLYAIQRAPRDEFLSDIIDSIGNAYKESDETYAGDVCVRCGLSLPPP